MDVTGCWLLAAALAAVIGMSSAVRLLNDAVRKEENQTKTQTDHVLNYNEEVQSTRFIVV